MAALERELVPDVVLGVLRLVLDKCHHIHGRLGVLLQLGVGDTALVHYTVPLARDSRELTGAGIVANVRDMLHAVGPADLGRITRGI